MNARKLIAAVIVFAVTGSAFAEAEHTPNAEGFVSTKSRAEVRNELIQWEQTHPHHQAGVNDLYFG